MRNNTGGLSYTTSVPLKHVITVCVKNATALGFTFSYSSKPWQRFKKRDCPDDESCSCITIYWGYEVRQDNCCDWFLKSSVTKVSVQFTRLLIVVSPFNIFDRLSQIFVSCLQDFWCILLFFAFVAYISNDSAVSWSVRCICFCFLFTLLRICASSFNAVFQSVHGEPVLATV